VFWTWIQSNPKLFGEADPEIMNRNTSLGSFADPESGVFLPLDPGSGMMNIQDHFSESLETFLGLKILKFFHADPDPKSGILFNLDPGWKNSDPGSEINIPDPQHCLLL
jgi:hypothetical protein